VKTRTTATRPSALAAIQVHGQRLTAYWQELDELEVNPKDDCMIPNRSRPTRCTA